MSNPTKARAIGAAACALLGTSTLAQAEAKWEIDTATLVYSETDRVSLVEPVLAARRSWEDHSLGARLTLDTLTGPSPSGATPASTPQTITGPSGNGGYTTKPGEIPLDDSFKDTRVAVALDYSAPLLAGWQASYGLNFSNEYDYQSLGGSLRVQRDFFQRNTTLAFGVALAQDSIDPVGGAPIPLSMLAVASGDDDQDEGEDEGDDGEGGGSSKSKTVVDLLVGVTQILDPHSLLRINLSYSDSSGYLNDPYKILSVVGNDGEPLHYVYESRPDSRTKTGIFTEYLRDFGGDTLHLSYRYQTDDWSIDSQTVELAYRWRYTDASYVEPQLRYYVQTAADFYRVALDSGEETTLANASADYRLGAMDAWTAGLQFGHTFAGGSELMLRVAYYLQSPDEKGLQTQAAAGLEKFGRLVPDTKAVMASIGYRFSL